MSRYCERNVEPILAAAVLWRDKCLVGNGSLFSNNSVWTLVHLGEMKRYFIDNPDEGSDSFLVKFQKQLEDALPGTKQLAAELMWLLFLFQSNITPYKKIETIREIWGWASAILANHSLLTEDVLGVVLVA